MVLPLGPGVARAEGAITVLVHFVSGKLIRTGMCPAIQVIAVILAGEITITVEVFFAHSKEAVAVVVLSITYLWRIGVYAWIVVIAVVVRAIVIIVSVLVRRAISIVTAGVWRAISIVATGIRRRTVAIITAGIRRRTVAVVTARIRRETVAIVATRVGQRAVAIVATGIGRWTITVRAGQIVGARDPRRESTDHNENKRGHGGCQNGLNRPGFGGGSIP
jgi:hypothetical protein